MRIYGNFMIERATLKDVPSIAVMEYRLRAESEGEDSLTPESEKLIMQSIFNNILNPNMTILVLTLMKHRKRRIVGMSAVFIGTDADGPVAFGSSLYVDPKYRDTEAAKMLFEAVEQVAKEKKAHTLIADTASDNSMVISLLEHNGYHKSKVILVKALNKENEDVKLDK